MKRIAIACQGGGSHCAFTGGVLTALLQRVRVDDAGRLLLDGHEIVGLSGTSGGAISAYLAWLDLLRLRAGVPREPGEPFAVERFWKANAAQLFGRFPYDLMTNLTLVGMASLEGALANSLPATPGAAMRAIQAHLRAQIEAAAGDLGFLQAQAAAEASLPRAGLRRLPPGAAGFPLLVLGAANVNQGVFEPFVGTPSHPPSIEQLVASTAPPDVFPSVGLAAPTRAPQHGTAPGAEPSHAHYWDGLLSQNPPISDFLGVDERAAKPDEIWIVRINPVCRRNGAGRVAIEPPTRGSEVVDRRNELAGNLSLEQEKRFIRRINRLHAQGELSARGRGRYKKVALWGLALDGWADVPEDAGHPEGDWRQVRYTTPRLYTQVLDHATKLLRGPLFLAELDAVGREAAQEFLAHRRTLALAEQPQPAADPRADEDADAASGPGAQRVVKLQSVA